MQPSVYFNYAFPLDEDRRELAKSRNIPYPEWTDVDTATQAWAALWQEANKDERIIKRLIELTGRTLPYPVEVCIIGGIFDAMSIPLIIPLTRRGGVRITDPDFLQILVHELCHRFTAPRENAPGTVEYWEAVKARYSAEPLATQKHILIYALLKKIVPDMLGEESWNRCQQSPLPTYQRALQLMEERGADDCLNEFRSYVTNKP
ncbi:hypothetical protein KBD34_01230 [Patescibacteria group bacterium]|nr:hypothetical protein [Patescibacteria group bacterium]